MVLHKDLSGGDLHEPKGIESAPEGSVYTSNGDGGGSWGSINTVNVTTKTEISSDKSGIVIPANYTLDQVLQIIIDRIPPEESGST